MSDYSRIPAGGHNPYADHPGFGADGCGLRITITPRDSWGRQAGGGFACSMTGGHCLPSEQCAQWRAEAAEQDRVQALLEQARAEGRFAILETEDE